MGRSVGQAGQIGCLLLATLGGSGCGTGALPAEEVTLPDALTCAQTSWTLVRPLDVGSTVPSNLALRDGTFYISLASMGIVALPATGGDPVVLTPEFGWKLWLEGDALYFHEGSDTLLRVPLTGGTPELVVQGLTTSVGPAYGISGESALDASYFYWDLSSQSGPRTYSVWRAARAGGAAEKLADLPPRDPVYSWPVLTPTPDALIVSLDTQNVAYAVPLAGGNMRMLPPAPAPAPGTSNRLIGSSEAGVLWLNERWDTGELYPTSRLSFSDARDPRATAARPFWPEKPPFMRPWTMASWPDGAGGWLITGVETHADGKAHASIWAVDGAGANGRRLGCNPNGGLGSVGSMVLTPEAVYAVVNHDDDTTTGGQWLLVRMDRAPAAL